MKDIDIARAAIAKPIQDIADRLSIPASALKPYGHDKAKIDLNWLQKQPAREDSKLVLVTAINPTPAGEGKTTTTVGLGDGLNAIGKQAIMCLREPSLGPCFGMKGGAAGGGYAQVIPMEDINLHFTGDFHAITSAHNLLSAMIDNHIYWGNEEAIDVRRVVWRRVLDMNDRALRHNMISMGGVANGFPREYGFDITVASEIMAILCLANDMADLQARLGAIIIGYRRDKSAVTCADIQADGAMTVLLKEAMQPNLVQTLEQKEAMQCEWAVKHSRKLRGPDGRVKHLSRLLTRDKWTSNSPHIKGQPLTIYIDDDYKHHLQSNQKISLKELYWKWD